MSSGDSNPRSRFRRFLFFAWGECEPGNEEETSTSDTLHDWRSYGSPPSRLMSREARADESVSAPAVSRKCAFNGCDDDHHGPL